MEDKTPIYLLSIVGIVALVAVVYMLTGTNTSTNNTINAGNAITGNVVDEEIPATDLRGVVRFIFGIALLGSCVYMYKKWE